MSDEHILVELKGLRELLNEVLERVPPKGFAARHSFVKYLPPDEKGQKIDTTTVTGRVKKIMIDFYLESVGQGIADLDARLIRFSVIGDEYDMRHGPLARSSVATIFTRLVRKQFIKKSGHRGIYRMTELFLSMYSQSEEAMAD